MDTEAARSFEDAIIDDMRANGGAVTHGPLAGHPLLVMTSTGARSGEPRRALLTISRDRDDYIVAGTAGGSPTAPAWLANVQSNPAVSVETGDETFAATATAVVDGPERDRLWDQHVAALPHFAAYPEQTGRLIPMVRISRT
ncbi:MAG: nitroreductase family deazaflavin-dependent oxidoreductase [Chloroflexi bacterium]|nr:nitroreductase family deazaflavin-dependent oxidoreductase [Chloroflexota bacterium]